MNGAIGVVTWPNGNCATQTPEFTTDPATLNKMRLSSLATQLGFDIYPMSSSVPDSEFYVLPENLPDGEYSYGIECRVADADWWITRGQSGLSRVAELPTTGAESGEILNIRESATGLKMIVISLD